MYFAGVFNSSLQLSDQPPLGSWTITVTAEVQEWTTIYEPRLHTLTDTDTLTLWLWPLTFWH